MTQYRPNINVLIVFARLLARLHVDFCVSKPLMTQYRPNIDVLIVFARLLARLHVDFRV
jgi:hypothetical protein